METEVKNMEKLEMIGARIARMGNEEFNHITSTISHPFLRGDERNARSVTLHTRPYTSRNPLLR